MSVAGFFKGLAKGILGFLLGVCIILLIMSLSLSQFTNHDSIKPQMVDILSSSVGSNMSIGEENFSGFKEMAAFACTGQETIELPSQDMPITLNCAEIQNLQSAEQFKTYMYGQIFDKMYYYNYNCTDIIQCFRQNQTASFAGGPFVLMSKTANDSFAKYTIYSLIALIVICILLLLFKPFSASLKGIGISATIVGLATFGMPSIKKLALQKVPAESQTVISPVLNSLFEILKKNFMICLIIGAAILAAGIILGIALKEKSKGKEKKKK